MESSGKREESVSSGAPDPLVAEGELDGDGGMDVADDYVDESILDSPVPALPPPSPRGDAEQRHG